MRSNDMSTNGNAFLPARCARFPRRVPILVTGFRFARPSHDRRSSKPRAPADRLVRFT